MTMENQTVTFRMVAIHYKILQVFTNNSKLGYSKSNNDRELWFQLLNCYFWVLKVEYQAKSV